MFDIGFSEILVIAVVALIVIGPERLPKVARTLGHLVARMQRYVGDVKADIAREMEIEELRKLQASMHDAARSIQQSVQAEISSAHSELNDIAASATGDSASSSVGEVPPPTHASEPPPAQLELELDANKETRKQP